MTIDKATEELKKIDRGLFIEPRAGSIGQYYAIRHKDDRTGLVRDVFEVLSDEGKPKPLEMSEIRRVARGIDWEQVRKYKEPEAAFKAWKKELEIRKAKAALEKRGVTLDIIKDRRKYWRQAMNEFYASLTTRQVRQMKRDHERKEYERSLKNRGRKIFTGV